MNRHDNRFISDLRYKPLRILLLSGLILMTLIAVLLVSACGGASGSSGSSATTTTGCNLTLDELNDIGSAPPECLALLPDPTSTLNPRVFILGSETDALDGKLHIFVHGVDANNVPLALDDFQNASVVTVDGTVRLDNGADMNGGGVTVQPIVDGSKISFAFLTDYSDSISDENLVKISEAYAQVLNALPAGFEAQVLNFSNFTDVRQDWSQDLPTLLSAVEFDPAFVPRDSTALYDGIGNTLDRLNDNPASGFGLADRCRPARIFVAHTDGLENASFTYTKGQLLTRINDSRVVAIMLGTLTANVTELAEFAGDSGAYVYAYDVDGINAAVTGWAGSFANIVEFVIDTGVFNADIPGKVEIGLDSLSATVEAPYDVLCTPVPVP